MKQTSTLKFTTKSTSFLTKKRKHHALVFEQSTPQSIDKPIIDNNNNQSSIDIDFRDYSIGIDKEKKL